MTGLADGRFRPLPYRLFRADRVVDAFRHMAQGRHLGKVVVVHERDRGSQPASALVRADGTYLVTGVVSDQYGDGPRRQHLVECALSEKYEGMVEYFAALRRAGTPLLVRENEVLSEPVVDDEPVSVADAIQSDLVTETGILRWDGTKRWGSSQWG